MRVPRFNVWFVVTLILLVGSLGCHDEQTIPGRATATGKVTYDGKPLPGGVITFLSQDDPTLRTSCSIDDGEYRTDRVPIGPCQVGIDTESLQFGYAAAYVPIPEKYHMPETSGLTADFKPGDNKNIDFTLEKGSQ